MADIKLLPALGINMQARDDDMTTEAGRYLRDALNVDISAAGKVALRHGIVAVTEKPYQDIWQSPLHGDTFARLDMEWVKINSDWSYKRLTTIGHAPCYHAVLNNRVVVAGEFGLFEYDGKQAIPLTIEAPPPPFANVTEGVLDKGDYQFAAAWLRGDKQSALSTINTIRLDANQGFTITLPHLFDNSVTGCRVFVSKANGTQLYRLGDYPIDSAAIVVTDSLQGKAEFANLSPMPSGKYLSLWRGRLVTAASNRIMFSQPLAYHLHDTRFDFVLLPQRVSFVAPVVGGLWVGLTDSVVFLSGANPNELAISKKGSGKPVPDSAMLVASDALGEIAQGNDCAVWLSENGYCVGLSSGDIIELHANKIRGISAAKGKSVRLKDRFITVLS